MAASLSPRSSSSESRHATSISGSDGRNQPGPSTPYFVICSVTAVLALMTASECSSVTHLPSLLYGVMLWGWWGLLAGLLWWIGKESPSMTPFSPRLAIAHLFVAPLAAYVHLILLWSLGYMVAPAQRARALEADWHRLIELNRFGTEILVYGFIVGVIGAIQYHIRSQRDAIHSSELQRQLASAQLQALQMQMEPHFLFNTLNAITTLVELGRQREAAQMLTHLNSILKTTLARTTPQKVPLSQELEIVENYLAIERVRFADRLQLDIRIEQGALSGLVPSFLLQPIVENAIRHGIAHCEDQGVIETVIRRDGASLHLRIRDTGPGVPPLKQNGNGIGLKNTRERLHHFYQDRFEMKAAPMEAGGFEVAISIPYEVCA
jgi:signal transduction histidine kinase